MWYTNDQFGVAKGTLCLSKDIELIEKLCVFCAKGVEWSEKEVYWL